MTDYPVTESVQSTGQDGSDVCELGYDRKRLLNTTTDVSKRSGDEIIDHLRGTDDQPNQNELGNHQNREPPAMGNREPPAADNEKGDHEIIVNRPSLLNPDDGAKVNYTADKHAVESCCTSVINYICEHKYELICGVCIAVAIASFIAFLIPSVVIPFKSPQSQKVNTTSLIKPHYFPFGGSDYYCILVKEISEFSNGKVTLSSSRDVSKKVTLAITEELVTTIDEYDIPNTTLRTGFIQRFKLFNSFVVNGFNLEIDVETDTGGILNITQLQIDKHGKAHTIKTENITLANESVKNFNYSTNESGFYELSLRGYEGITGTLSGHASYSSCRSNQSYPHNCSIVFQGDTKKCEVNVSTITSGYILLILEYDDTIFSVTETGTIRLKDKDNTAAKSAMIAITIICCGLITMVTILWLLRKYRHAHQFQNRICMQLHDTETPDISSASSSPANEHTPLIDIKIHENQSNIKCEN